MRDICRSNRIAFRSNDRLFLPKTETRTTTASQPDVSQAEQLFRSQQHNGSFRPDFIWPLHLSLNLPKTLPILTANKYCTIPESPNLYLNLVLNPVWIPLGGRTGVLSLWVIYLVCVNSWNYWPPNAKSFQFWSWWHLPAYLNTFRYSLKDHFTEGGLLKTGIRNLYANLDWVLI